MKGKTVFVITDLEAGWDCVRGVYLDEDDAIDYIKDMTGWIQGPDNEPFDLDETPYIIHEETIE